MLACDVDDMSPEYLAAVADRARAEGALDVMLLPTVMKKGAAGTRIELLCRPRMPIGSSGCCLPRRRRSAFGARR